MLDLKALIVFWVDDPGWVFCITPPSCIGGLVVVYFLLCIIVCSFFVLNLTIAVMLLKYEEADNAQDSSHDQELFDYGH